MLSVHYRGFCLTVLGESGDMKYKNFKLNIKKLPYEIDSDASYHKVTNALQFVKLETLKSPFYF